MHAHQPRCSPAPPRSPRHRRGRGTQLGSPAQRPRRSPSNWYGSAPYVMPLDNNPPDLGHGHGRQRAEGVRAGVHPRAQRRRLHADLGRHRSGLVRHRGRRHHQRGPRQRRRRLRLDRRVTAAPSSARPAVHRPRPPPPTSRSSASTRSRRSTSTWRSRSTRTPRRSTTRSAPRKILQRTTRACTCRSPSRAPPAAPATSARTC